MSPRHDVDAETDRLYWRMLDSEDARRTLPPPNPLITFEDGKHVGLLALSCNLNPHDDGTEASREWRRGWMQGTSELVFVDV